MRETSGLVSRERRVLRSKELRRAIAIDRMRESKLSSIRSDRAKREAAMHKLLPVIRIEAVEVASVAYKSKERSLHASVPRRSITKRAPYRRWGNR